LSCILAETKKMAGRKLFGGLSPGDKRSLIIRAAAILLGLDLSHGAGKYCG
jgi:hypothetical protein